MSFETLILVEWKLRPVCSHSAIFVSVNVFYVKKFNGEFLASYIIVEKGVFLWPSPAGRQPLRDCGLQLLPRCTSSARHAYGKSTYLHFEKSFKG